MVYWFTELKKTGIFHGYVTVNNQMANMIWLVLWNHGMDRS